MIAFQGGNLSAMAQDDVLAQGWKLAEFGIFGDGGGSDATFNVGATMAVRTTVDDGTSNAPRAAVCLDPTRLIIDGTQRDLGNDQSLSLPSGVHIAHSGNAYLFTRPSGESVRAEVNNPGYINVSVDLGAAPQAKVYGLLGNANGNMGEDDLATRHRVVLKQPLSFEELYHPYSDSWRVFPRESLLSKLCGDKGFERGIPEKPFYAEDLSPQERERARAICTEAGVKDESLLDACILDTTVLGTKEAATVFARAHPPRAEVRVSSRRREP